MIIARLEVILAHCDMEVLHRFRDKAVADCYNDQNGNHQNQEARLRLDPDPNQSGQVQQAK